MILGEAGTGVGAGGGAPTSMTIALPLMPGLLPFPPGRPLPLGSIASESWGPIVYGPAGTGRCVFGVAEVLSGTSSGWSTLAIGVSRTILLGLTPLSLEGGVL
jgi:hypothetical protein